MLLDTPTQVHLVLRKFIEYIQSKESQENPNITVDLIKLIFNLALSEFNQAYKLHTNVSEVVKKIVTQNFEQMGLIEFTQEDRSKFYITKHMQSFLLTQTGNVGAQEGVNSELMRPKQDGPSNEKFIIVETNFRVYARTENKLYREVLKLFLEPKVQFENMFFGLLTKSRVERAFR